MDDNGEGRQHDIKIEDNLENEEDVTDEEDLIPPPRKQMEKVRREYDEPQLDLEDERPLDSESGENIFDSENLGVFKGNIHKELLENMLNDEGNYKSNRQPKRASKDKFDDIEKEIEADFKLQEEQFKRDESSHLKVHDKTGSNATTNDEGAKMNKICFGVFASISHEFILENNHKADEISLSLQSAFRVISLTRPEYKIILKTLLKCEGIKDYEELGANILEFVRMIREAAPAGVTDRHFSFTYYDLQAIVKSIGFLTEENWKDKAKKYLKIREEKLAIIEDPTNDYRDKALLEEKKAETEAMLDNMERKDRISVECDATVRTLELYAVQR